jgi:hypothetical protein
MTILSELEKSRGYIPGAADRIRKKLGLPIPSEDQRIAWIEENIKREEDRKKFAMPDYELKDEDVPCPKEAKK